MFQFFSGFQFFQGFARRKHSRKHVSRKKYAFGFFIYAHVFGHALAGILMPLICVIDRLDPFHVFIDKISDPFQRSGHTSILALLSRWLLSTILISECVRFASIGSLIILSTVRIYVSTLRQLSHLPNDILKYSGKFFRQQYLKLKLIHACLHEAGDHFILVLMGFGLLALTFLAWGIVRFFGDVSYYMYGAAVFMELGFVLFVEMTLPVAVVIDEMSEEIVRKWRTVPLSWKSREKRFLSKCCLSLRPLYWSAGSLYLLNRPCRIGFYDAIFSNVVGLLLTDLMK